MSERVGDDFEARLSSLAARVERSLERARVWIEPLDDPRVARHTQALTGRPDEVLDAMREQLQDAESNAGLQAQRCAALEDRVAELEASLVGARSERDAALAQAASTRAALEAERSAPTQASEQSGLGAEFQSKLLENDRLRSERDNLRRSLDEWRKQARGLRRERDEAKAELDDTRTQTEDLRKRHETAAGHIDELQRRLAAQNRELEVAKARAEHMRERIRVAR